MAQLIKAPGKFPDGGRSVFLSGSIEMGAAEDWQTRVALALDDLDIAILNPRRDDWDSSWVQSITDMRFEAQVRWELLGMRLAHTIAVYFAPETKAPITLLELGLAARSGKAIVCCPNGFYRKGNVEVVCSEYGIPLVDTLEELVERVRTRLVAPRSWERGFYE